LKHLELAGDGHWLNQGLVAISEVGAEPEGGMVEGLGGPGAIV
jgi:hypothetical protein